MVKEELCAKYVEVRRVSDRVTALCWFLKMMC